MFDRLYHHINGGGTDVPCSSIDMMFGNNVRFQVLCRNQEEKDYLQALCLVYGRQLQIDTWGEWTAKVALSEARAYCDSQYQPLRLLPVVYTTFHVNLRGY